MSEPLEALEVPGRLVLGATNLAGSFPYGGTELGMVRDLSWVLVDVYQRTRAEELGVAVVGDLWCGEAFSIAFALRGFNDTAKAAVWENSRVGAVSQHRVVYGPGARRPGARTESSKASALLFVPDDLLNHDAVVLPRALPRRDPVNRVSLRLRDEHLVAMTWLAIPGSNGLAYEIGRMADLTAL